MRVTYLLNSSLAIGVKIKNRTVAARIVDPRRFIHVDMSRMKGTPLMWPHHSYNKDQATSSSSINVEISLGHQVFYSSYGKAPCRYFIDQTTVRCR